MRNTINIANFRESRSATQDSIQACIVVPTYNEAGNIRKLLNNIFLCEKVQPYRKNNITLKVLVVDDNSPDGTAEITEEYRKKNPKVHLLRRQVKKGLGVAYISGMQHAIENLRPDVVLEMDADHSHNPRYIFSMLMEIKKGADFVIGSRYIPGGSIPKQWSMRRKIISQTANAFARTMLNMRHVKDCTGGFRAIRVSALDKIDLNSLDVKGYSFQISLLNAIIRSNLIVREIPIAFKDRTNGKSKMKLSDISEFGTIVLKKAAQSAVRRMFLSSSQSSKPRENPKTIEQKISRTS